MLGELPRNKSLTHQEDSNEFSIDEINVALSQTKSGKADSFDRILPRMRFTNATLAYTTIFDYIM